MKLIVRIEGRKALNGKRFGINIQGGSPWTMLDAIAQGATLADLMEDVMGHVMEDGTVRGMEFPDMISVRLADDGVPDYDMTDDPEEVDWP